MRWRLDATWSRAGDGRVVWGGSPLRLFRLSAAGARVADLIESGESASSVLTQRLVDAGALHPVPVAPAVVGTRDVTIVTPQLGGSPVRDGRITVDDASAPPLVDVAVRLEVNRGPSGARNAGRGRVETELIAFVDADVDVGTATERPLDDADWWAPLLAHFDDPSVGLVAPRVTGDDGSSLDLGPEPGRVRAGTRISYVPGAMMIVRASAFDVVGGFDETLRSGEDVDLAWRLDEAGWMCRYEPRRAVHHRPRPNVVGRIRQQINYGASSGPLALRHPRSLAPYRSNGWTAGVWALVAAGHPAFAGVLALGSASAAVTKLTDLPAADAMSVAMRGHARAGGQLATAVRRAWWPLVVLASLASRRARRLLILSVLADPRRLHIDLAFGWGLWASMLRHREFRPIVPDLRPGRSFRALDTPVGHRALSRGRRKDQPRGPT
ncbi:MAG: glycosyltransferase family 2 protein [Ilumatobacter sp.]